MLALSDSFINLLLLLPTIDPDIRLLHPLSVDSLSIASLSSAGTRTLSTCFKDTRADYLTQANMGKGIDTMYLFGMETCSSRVM